MTTFYIDIGMNNTSVFIESNNNYYIRFIKNTGEDIVSKKKYLKNEYYKILNKFDDVGQVFIEDTFYNRLQPKGFRAVVEAINIVEMVSYIFNDNIKVDLISPSTIKSQMGGSGKCKKEKIQEAFINRIEYLKEYRKFKEVIEDYYKTHKRKSDKEHIIDSIILYCYIHKDIYKNFEINSD